MIKLLKIEWKKIKPYSTFRWLIGLYVVCLLLFFISAQNFRIGSFRPFSDDLLRFPDVWHNITYLAAVLFNLILGVIIIVLITNEYQYKTIRQNIIDGLNRKYVVLAKTYLLISIAIACTLIVALFALIIGLWNTPGDRMDLIFDKILFIPAYAAQTIALLAFASLFAHLFRKAGITILMFLLYIGVIEPIFRGQIPFKFVNYMPAKSIYSIIQFPYIDLISSNSGLSAQPAWNYCLISLGYTFLFIGLSYLLLKRRDL